MRPLSRLPISCLVTPRHEALLKLDEDTLLAVFEGVPHFDISRDELAAGIKAVDLCN